jgi:hypothetical protein
VRREFRGLIWFTLVVALLAGGAWECAGAPTSQCQDGTSRTRTVNHKRVYEICSNGEWVKGTPPRARLAERSGK